ncbi:uncharacterized protein LOC126808591 [Patella vulgata]|uniref:uncharacterized protein LOC126808591 n=1 Tax=Patella vulgata TaxID=6465 RepID=UPI00217F94D9|nr:uncharacterized protein LOC126808591 [Patella vulgata]XP_050389372.1 uncharacterized protein LOC126808591 [Patella vulgata]
MPHGNRHGRQGFKGGRRSGGGGGGGGYRNDRKGGFGGRDYEDRFNRGGGNWDDGGFGGGGFGGRSMGGKRHVMEENWNMMNQEPRRPTLPKGNPDYWEYKDTASDNEECSEVEPKRPRLEVEDGLLPGAENVTCVMPVPKPPVQSEEDKKPKPLLDSPMFDEYYEYFDGGPVLPTALNPKPLDQKSDAPGPRDEFWDTDIRNGMSLEDMRYRIIPGEPKYFEGPGPRSTELIRIGQDGRRVSPEEKMFVFVQILLRTPFKKSAVEVMEIARGKMNKKQAICLNFQITPEDDDSDNYQCQFSAAGFKITTTEGSTKEEAKTSAAEQGLYILMTKTFNEICPSNYYQTLDDGNYETKVRTKDDPKETKAAVENKDDQTTDETKASIKTDEKEEKDEKEDKEMEEEGEKDENTEKDENEENTEKDENEENKEKDENTEKNENEENKVTDENEEKDEKEEKGENDENKGKEGKDNKRTSEHKRHEQRGKKSPTWRSPKLIIRLQIMKKIMEETLARNCYSDMEAVAYTCEVALCIVCYKRYRFSGGSDPMKCDMYADEMYLGTGSGSNFEEALFEVYMSARDNLIRTSVHSLLMNNKRLSELDRNDPKILDIIYRGHYQEIGSNRGSLKTFEVYPPDLDKSTDEVIILQSEDKHTTPFRILKSSITQSGLLIEWVLSAKDDHSACRCLVYLQGKRIVDVRGPTKFKAKNAASEMILKGFNATHSVIRCSPMEFSEPTLSMENLKQQARELCDEQNIITDEELTPWMHKVLEKLIDEKLEGDTLDLIILCEDIGGKLRKFIRSYADSKKYLARERPSDTRKNLIIQKRLFTAKEMVDILELNNYESGKFKLIQKRDGDILTKYWTEDGSMKLDVPESINISDIQQEEEMPLDDRRASKGHSETE